MMLFVLDEHYKLPLKCNYDKETGHFNVLRILKINIQIMLYFG